MLDMVLPIPNYERLEQFQCRRLRGRYNSTGTLQISPSGSFQPGMQRRSSSGVTWSVSLSPGTEWEQVTVFRDSSGYTEHKLWGWFCQQTVSVERLLFPGHNVLQVTEWVSKEMLWFCSWLFAHLGLHRAEFGSWFTYKRVTVENMWKLWFLKASETWQFHLVGNVYMDVCKFFSSFIWTQRE